MSSDLRKRWQVESCITAEANEALAAYSPIMRQILFNRGYATDKSARAYLKADTDFDTSPFQMTGMQVTVDRLRYALANHEQIALCMKLK